MQARTVWSRASGEKPNDREALQKFRILDYIRDELHSNEKFTLSELKDVLEMVDRFEGPLSVEMRENEKKEKLAKDKQAVELNAGEQEEKREQDEEVNYVKKSKKRLRRERQKLEEEKKEEARKLERERDVEAEIARIRPEFERQVRLMTEREEAKKATRKAAMEGAMDIDS
jgi:hypothetical protein